MYLLMEKAHHEHKISINRKHIIILVPYNINAIHNFTVLTNNSSTCKSKLAYCA